MTVGEYLQQSPLYGGITDGCQAVDMLNAARELMWPLEDWVGTIEYGCVCATGCFYLPAYIEVVRKSWKCNKNIPVNNEGWLYLDANAVNEVCGQPISIVRTDRHVVLPRSFPQDAQIGFSAQDAADEGKGISVTIRNVFGSTVAENVRLGSIREVSWAELAVRELISISKPVTEGAVAVWSRLPGCIRQIYVLESYETDVVYWQYQAIGVCECIVIKGKKKFFPYRQQDLNRQIDIRPVQALRFASQAIEHERSRRYDDYIKALQIARNLAERSKEDIVKTSAPGVVAPQEVSTPISSGFYGY